LEVDPEVDSEEVGSGFGGGWKWIRRRLEVDLEEVGSGSGSGFGCWTAIKYLLPERFLKIL
jgi:hypothetical protein